MANLFKRMYVVVNCGFNLGYFLPRLAFEDEAKEYHDSRLHDSSYASGNSKGRRPSPAAGLPVPVDAKDGKLDITAILRIMNGAVAMKTQSRLACTRHCRISYANGRGPQANCKNSN